MREVESFSILPIVAFMIMDAEALGDDGLEVDTPPTYDAMHHPIRASFDEVGKFGPLISRQTRLEGLWTSRPGSPWGPSSLKR